MKQPCQIASISDYASRKWDNSMTLILQIPLLDSFNAEGATELLLNHSSPMPIVWTGACLIRMKRRCLSQYGSITRKCSRLQPLQRNHVSRSLKPWDYHHSCLTCEPKPCLQNWTLTRSVDGNPIDLTQISTSRLSFLPMKTKPRRQMWIFWSNLWSSIWWYCFQPYSLMRYFLTDTSVCNCGWGWMIFYWGSAWNESR